MKRLVLGLVAIFSCMSPVVVHGASTNSPTGSPRDFGLVSDSNDGAAGDAPITPPNLLSPKKQITYNLAGLAAAVTVYKVVTKRLAQDQKAQEIEIAKQNIADGFRDMIEQTEEAYVREAKRQAAQRYYNVRPPSKEEIERQVEEDRLIADAYRRGLHEPYQDESGDEQGDTDEQGVPVSVDDDSMGNVPLGETTVRDEQLAEYVEEDSSPDDAAVQGDEQVEQEEFIPLPTWKRRVLKVIRYTSIAAIVYFVAQLAVSGFRWKDHYYGNVIKTIGGAGGHNSLECAVDAPSTAHHWFNLAKNIFQKIDAFYRTPKAEELKKMDAEGKGDHSIQSIVASAAEKDLDPQPRIAQEEAFFWRDNLKMFSELPKQFTHDNPYVSLAAAPGVGSAANMYQNVRDGAFL
ncbi:MAG: hypothetical protein PVJ92_03485, partial [Candidatus Dependentiae bacterium]